MLQKLFNQLNSDTLVITPNRRLALYVQQEFDRAQKNSGKKSWPSAAILPIAQYLEIIWHNYASAKILLNQHQEHIIWQKIITAFAHEKALVNIEGTIEQAQQAYALLRNWCINLDDPLFSLSEDTATFQTWANEFISICKANNWIAHSDIANNISLSKPLILAGFDQLSPQLKTLLHSCQVEYCDPNNKRSHQVRLSIPDQEQELISMALWAKQRTKSDPAATIGCVVPDLSSLRPQVEYIFNKINAHNFDISVGQKLKDFPLIAAALQILKPPVAPLLKGDLQPPSKWARYFTNQLQNLNSNEYQLVERWGKLLSEFASLDLVIAKLSHADALQQLNSLAANTIFQPKLQHSTPIKILGTLEAAGLNFDYLWVMGLNDTSWPPPPQPNPFIPIHLQKKLLMPHACNERELYFCRLLTERFARSASDIVYSYPLQNKDQLLRASPLIKHIPEITLEDLNLPKFTPYSEKTALLETLIDAQAPKVTQDEQLGGGSKIFQLQAACPFRAFAECRLHAKELETSQIGLNAQERGLLVHTMLEQAWNIIGNYDQLCSYSETKLKSIINECVANSLAKINNKPQFIKLETKRLAKLLWDWLTLEKTRIPFRVIAQEQWHKINIGELKDLATRIDRIDQLQDGSLIIIDYKTGIASIQGWFGERPDDPQLPLYCVTSNKPIHGLIFAQVKNGALTFKGKTQKSEQIPNIKEPLTDNYINQWRMILHKLGKDFCAGNAAVDPKDGKTCRNCKLQNLCRVGC